MLIFNYCRNFISSFILLCTVIFVANAQAESGFIDKIKSVSIGGITITEIKTMIRM